MYKKTIHDVAKEVIESGELPELRFGLCWLFNSEGADSAYHEVSRFMPLGSPWHLPEEGTWTEQRLNCIALLACTSPEDFEACAISETALLIRAGLSEEEAQAARKARIASPVCHGPWNPDNESVSQWLSRAFSWLDYPIPGREDPYYDWAHVYLRLCQW